VPHYYSGQSSRRKSHVLTKVTDLGETLVSKFDCVQLLEISEAVVIHKLLASYEEQKKPTALLVRLAEGEKEDDTFYSHVS
jgi:hypothetical protein